MSAAIAAQAAGAALPILLGLIGEAVAAGDERKADELRQQAMAQFNIPPAQFQQLEARAQQSQAAGAQGNQEAQLSRLDVMRELQRRSAEGYTAEDRAAIGDTLSEVDQNTRGRNEAMLQGIDPNSGAALAARAGNAQAATQVANKRGLDIAAGSRAAAMRALMARGDVARGVDQDAFGQSLARGQAGDAMSQFNERNRMDAGRYNNQMAQQGYQNQVGMADRRAEGIYNEADERKRKAQRTRQLYGGIGSGLQQGVLGGLKAGGG